jgi:TFIIF-interacting CTD phosphatase-like protein
MNKVIILDIDNTLINSVKPFDHNIECDFHICFKQYMVFKRPHVDEFITHCFDTFDNVVVWSSGTRNYVDEIVNNLFSPIQMPHAVLAREHCSSNNAKNLVSAYKTLENHGININESTIYFVDDKPHNIQNLDDDYIIPIHPFVTRRANRRKRSFSGDRDDHLIKIKKIL